jgi:hypothetical protein
METTNPALTRVQLRTLLAVTRGEISKPAPGIDYDAHTWRDGARNGRAVTAPVEALIRKGFARIADEPVDDRVLAQATPRGHEALSRAAHRGR